VHLEANTKPHVHRKFEIFWTNIASTVAYPNFKNGPKNDLAPLGVKQTLIVSLIFLQSKMEKTQSPITTKFRPVTKDEKELALRRASESGLEL
jgi:hypothetical protein